MKRKPKLPRHPIHRGDERNLIAKVPFLVAGIKRAAPLIAAINQRAADVRRSEPVEQARRETT